MKSKIINEYAEILKRLEASGEVIPNPDEKVWEEINENLRKFRLKFRHQKDLSRRSAENVLICD